MVKNDPEIAKKALLSEESIHTKVVKTKTNIIFPDNIADLKSDFVVISRYLASP